MCHVLTNRLRATYSSKKTSDEIFCVGTPLTATLCSLNAILTIFWCKFNCNIYCHESRKIQLHRTRKENQSSFFPLLYRHASLWYSNLPLLHDVPWSSSNNLWGIKPQNHDMNMKDATVEAPDIPTTWHSMCTDITQ